MFAMPCLCVCLSCCLHLSASVHVFTAAYACVLTVMKGLEFAAGGEFIITLIPLERYSPASPSHTYPSMY